MITIPNMALAAALVVGFALLGAIFWRYARYGSFRYSETGLSFIALVLMLASVWDTISIDIPNGKMELAKPKLEAELQRAKDQLFEAQGELAQLRAQRTNSPSPPPPPPPAAEPPIFEDARNNIRWVLQRDVSARATYDRARSSGASRFDALLVAQRHNSGASASIRAFGPERTEEFASANGG